MKALSIRQPWAWAILHAGKRVENRSWYCHYRGPILIHASKGMTRGEVEDFIEFILAPEIWAATKFPPLPPPPANLPRGGIVGRAVIVDCISESRDPWFFGPYGSSTRSSRCRSGRSRARSASSMCRRPTGLDR